MGSDMRTLAEDIVASHKWREFALGSIRNEVGELLKGFKEQAAERESEIFQMKKEVAGMLAGLRKEREKDAAAWHGILGRLHAKAKKEAGHGRGKKNEKSSSE